MKYLSSLLVLLVNVILVGASHYYIDKHADERITSSLIDNLRVDQGFLDDVYLANKKGILIRMGELVTSHTKRTGQPICIVITLNSFADNSEPVLIESCSEGATQKNIILGFDPLFSEEFSVSIGDKQLAEVFWVTHLSTPSEYFSSVIGLTIIEMLTMYYVSRLLIQVSRPSEPISVPKQPVDAEHALTKLINLNRSYFPFSAYTALAVYEHPYTHFYDVRGGKKTTRASLQLVDQATTGLVRLNKVNRKVLVNLDVLPEIATIEETRDYFRLTFKKKLNLPDVDVVKKYQTIIRELYKEIS